MIGLLLNYGRLQALLPGGHSIISYALPMLCSLAATFLLAINGEWRGVLATVALFVLGTISLAIFTARTGFALNMNAISIYSPLLTFPVLYWIFLNGGADHIVRILLYYTIVYAIFYIVLSFAIILGILHWDSGSIARLISGDSLRRDRIILAPGWVGLGICLTVARFRDGLNIKTVFLVVIFFSALALSLARIFSVSVALLIIFYLLTRSPKAVGYVSFAAFLIASSILLLGLADPTFNPFLGQGEDASVTARAVGYEYVRQQLHAFWLFGFGVPSSEDALVYATSSKLFFPVDLGTVGVVYSYGAVGGVLLVLSNWICATAWNAGRIFAEPSHQIGVCLAGAFVCLQGMSYSTVWLDSGLLLALILAMQMYQRRAAATEPVATPLPGVKLRTF